MSPVVLKKGKEIIFQRRHHWIFSGAIESFPSEMENGSLLPVVSHEGTFLGYAYFNRKTALSGRILSFDKTPPEQTLLERLQKALSMRKRFYTPLSTNAYRWINGEGDGLPGLIVDLYHDFLVLQIGTLGMEKLKPMIIAQLLSLVPLTGIYEKSSLLTRKEEGLPPFEGLLWGQEKEEVEILEEGICFTVSIKKGQKTGFFLDQREMRNLIGSLAKGRSLLNCFSYTGGFTLAALKGGALKTDSVDISQEALSLLQRNILNNHFSIEAQGIHCQDVFQYLKEQPITHDIVVLDPPAFAKKKNDIPSALKGYKTINREAMKKMKPGSLLLTCSCSYHVDKALFQKMLFQAALEAKKEVQILGRHRLGFDHPVNLYHPEGDYLKSFLLYLT